MPTSRRAACVLLIVLHLSGDLRAAEPAKVDLAPFEKAALAGGDAARGKKIFASEQVACAKCHVVDATKSKAGPTLMSIGDKYERPDLIREVLEPGARLHVDYVATTVTTTQGKVFFGIVQRRTEEHLELLDQDAKLHKVPVESIDEQQQAKRSFMPEGLVQVITPAQFADLIAYLESLRQPTTTATAGGLVNEMPPIEKPVKLVPLVKPDEPFDHPVWIVAIPGTAHGFLVVEQQTRKIWRLDEGSSKRRTLFLDLSREATTGQFEGVMCVAFHPNFAKNRKYYINHHVRDQGSHFSPVIIERLAAADLSRDSGRRSRRLLQIPQHTDLHWGGMLAFGPDNYLYIGAGDAGPQEDPEGHGQDMSLLVGKILRIDVDHRSGAQAYAIPTSNPFRGQSGVREEIWASGFRMPWRFSWDPLTKDLWVGEIGQNLFEEVSIVRRGENHGWNVYEGFTPFSQRFRRAEERYVPPVVSYRRKHGVSVTGGYVYRGNKSPSFVGVYIFGDYESKTIWGLTQENRQLTKIRRIGSSPQRIASFGIDHQGELFLVGHEGMIYRIDLSDAVFE